MTTPSAKADDAQRPPEPQSSDVSFAQQQQEQLRSKLYGELSDSDDSDDSDPPSSVSDCSDSAAPELPYDSVGVSTPIPRIIESPPSPFPSSRSSSLSERKPSPEPEPDSPSLFEKRVPDPVIATTKDVSQKFTAIFDDNLIDIEEELRNGPPEVQEVVKEKISTQSTNSSDALRYSRTATDEIFSDVDKCASYFSNIDLESSSSTNSEQSTQSISEGSLQHHFEHLTSSPSPKDEFPTRHQAFTPRQPNSCIEGVVTFPVPPAQTDTASPFLEGIMTKLCCFRTKDRNQQYKVPDEEPPAQFSWEQPNRPDPKNYRFANHNNTILVKRDGEIGGQQFTVDNCKNCTILLFDWTASVTIDDCENCLIIIGPCTGSVFIRTTKECTILCISQQLRTRDCSTLALFIFCVTQPTIEESHRIQFSPLFLYYDALEAQLRRSGLSSFNNNWDRVHDFSAENTSNYEIVSEGPSAVPHIAAAVGTCGLNVDNSTSALISCSNRHFDEEKAMVLCVQNSDEDLSAFYNRTVKLTHTLSEQLKLIECRDIKVRKGELKSLINSKTYAKYAGQMVVLEFAADAEAASKIKMHLAPGVQLVDAAQTVEYGKALHRFAEVQGHV